MSPFAAPAAPSGIDFKQLMGSLLMVEVLGHEEHVPTAVSKPGEKSPAVRGNLTVLDGSLANEVFEDALIFPKVLQGQLRSRVGQLVLGRLGQGQAKPGQSAPWKLEAASQADEAVAEAYLRTRGTAPVTSATSEPPF